MSKIHRITIALKRSYPALWHVNLLLLLIVMLGVSAVATAIAQPNAAPTKEVIQSLVKTAQELERELRFRVKDLDKRVDESYRRERKATRSLGRGDRQERLEIIALYRVERETLMDLRSTLGRERVIIENMAHTGAYGLEHLAKSRFSVSNYAHRNLRLEEEWRNNDEASKMRWEQAMNESLAPKLKEQMKAERAAFELAGSALRREWALLNYTLVMTNSITLEEALAHDARVAERERERYHQRAARLEESKRVLAGLVVVLGAVAVASSIADSPELSETEKKAQIESINALQEMGCIARGGHFIRPFNGLGIGSCVVP